MYTILLVDDYKPNLRLLEETFREAGFHFQSALSVAQAEDFLRNQSFDLVLSDIQMPGATGFDLLAWIQSQEMSEIPVLFITSAMPEPENRIRGLSLGAVDYVLRSLEPDELVLRVKKAIEHVRELKALKASLEDAEKLASLGRVIAATNHEVKNLAHIVRMSAEAIAKRGQDLQEEKSILLNAATMLADVTRSMNALLKDESSSLQSVDISELTQQMIFMTKMILRGIAIESSFDPKEKVWVQANPTFLKQVLLNLILNARDAILEKQESAGLICFSLSRDNYGASLSLVDNGVGLPEAGIKTDFPAFMSTKRLRGGTGLGLWMSARLLQGMGARIQLQSAGPGCGATATISLKHADPPGPKLDLSQYLQEL